jgi:WD40 repeat protein
MNYFESLRFVPQIFEGFNYVKVDQSPCLHAFIHDAKRFILYNRSIIEAAPLQTYWSALVFAPQRSLVRMEFKNEMPSGIKILVEVQHQWSSLLQTLEGHTAPICAITFSPDGKTVTSASVDETVRLWDAGDRGRSAHAPRPYA